VAADLILHETRTRLRVRVPGGADAERIRETVRRIAGVRSMRTNARLDCMIVHHDGDARTRAGVLRTIRQQVRDDADGSATAAPRPPGQAGVAWATAATAATAALAAALPVLPAGWRPGAGLGLVAVRAAVQVRRADADAPAVLLDSMSLGALALTGQTPVVSASVLLRLIAEALSARLVRQVDALLQDVLPRAADTYPVRRPEDARPMRRRLRQVRPGDRLTLVGGDVVPVDGCVMTGAATLHSVMVTGATRAVAPGEHVRAGERLVDGDLEVLAECDAASSRLERLRAQVVHAIASHDPVGRLAPDLERWISLPLTGAAVVLGLTGDGARAAAMLQADPMRGLDLALPVAREAAQYALARHGLLGAGLVSTERLAGARTLLLQDTAVLSTGRWALAESWHEPGGDAGRVLEWLAALAGVPETALATGGIADATVRGWLHEGALLRIGSHELHLAGGRRLERIWGLSMPTARPEHHGDALQRTFAFVAQGRTVATFTLSCALRPDVLRRLARLRALGFERIAVVVEDDGDASPAATGHPTWQRVEGVAGLAHSPAAIRAWLDAEGRADGPVVFVHTVLRDLVPPGGLSLAPANADTGAHAVLLGDPLASLERTRALALRVRRRLRAQQNLAVASNAALMTASALRWQPPMATALLHHGFALAVLLDSLLLERLAVAGRTPLRSPAATKHANDSEGNEHEDR
jgi:cation transport ATPase